MSMEKHEKYLRLAALTQERLQQEYLAEKVETARATAALQGALYSSRHSNANTNSNREDPCAGSSTQEEATQRYIRSLEENIKKLEAANAALRRRAEKGNSLECVRAQGETS